MILGVILVHVFTIRGNVLTASVSVINQSVKHHGPLVFKFSSSIGQSSILNIDCLHCIVIYIMPQRKKEFTTMCALRSTNVGAAEYKRQS